MKLTNFLAVLYLIGFISAVQAQKENESPNVIIILADDLGNVVVGFNSCVDIPTPNIDKLAENGKRFTNA